MFIYPVYLFIYIETGLLTNHFAQGVIIIRIHTLNGIFINKKRNFINNVSQMSSAIKIGSPFVISQATIKLYWVSLRNLVQTRFQKPGKIFWRWPLWKNKTMSHFMAHLHLGFLLRFLMLACCTCGKTTRFINSFFYCFSLECRLSRSTYV